MGWIHDYRPTAQQKRQVELLVDDTIEDMVAVTEADDFKMYMTQVKDRYEKEMRNIMPRLEDYHHLELIFKELAGSALFETLYWPLERPGINPR